MASVTKKHVLAEIRRTAEANGGRPLGRARFLIETGIRESDVVGRYWARWNDALAEAGFPPNVLQARLDDESLLDSLAHLTRELGHFPSRPELRIRAREPGFPSANTFARFGRKSQVAARLQRFCSERPELADVLPLAALAAGDSPPPESPEAAGIEFGYVYLLRSGRHYKIGRSNSVGRRERELAIQLPEKARLVHSIKTHRT